MSSLPLDTGATAAAGTLVSAPLPKPAIGTRTTAGVVLDRLARSPPTSASSPRPKRPRPGRCSTNCSPSTANPASRWSISSTPDWPKNRPMAGTTRTCRATARPGARRWPALDRDALRKHSVTFADCSDRSNRRVPQALPGASAARCGTACRPAGLEPVDPLRLHRLLLPPVGVERDRLRRSGLSARLQEPRASTGWSRSRYADAAPGCDPTDPIRRRSRPMSRGPGPQRSAWLLPRRRPAATTACATDMRTFDDDDEVDLVIVGCGAGGATLAAAPGPRGMACGRPRRRPLLGPRAGLGQRRGRVAPPVLDRTAGDRRRRPVPLGSNNSGRGVGGSMVHYAGYTPALPPQRLPHLHPRRRRRRLADRTTRTCGRTTRTSRRAAGRRGSTGPGAIRTATRTGRTRSAATASCSCAAPTRCGITAKVGPVAIANGRFGNRPHCIYRGFCLQGCKVNAKASPADHPRAGRPRARRRDPGRLHGHPHRASTNAPAAPPACTTSAAAWQRFQRARMVAVAGYSIETPRLLLNSASTRFPDGLCNDFDQVGRYLMVQGAPQTAGRFDAEVRMCKAPPPEVSTEEFYETDPTKPYKRGFSIQTVSPLPITWAEHVAAQGHWGAELRRLHERLRRTGPASGALCEFLPLAGQPRHPGRREGPARPAGRPVQLLPVRQRPAADEAAAQRSWRRS